MQLKLTIKLYRARFCKTTHFGICGKFRLNATKDAPIRHMIIPQICIVDKLSLRKKYPIRAPSRGVKQNAIVRTVEVLPDFKPLYRKTMPKHPAISPPPIIIYRKDFPLATFNCPQ